MDLDIHYEDEYSAMVFEKGYGPRDGRYHRRAKDIIKISQKLNFLPEHDHVCVHS